MSLRVRRPAGAEHVIDTLIDTGFSGTLTLPAPVIADLGLARRQDSFAWLADGSQRTFPTYAAEVEWGGGWRPVIVSGLGDEALVGMTFLAGHRLTIDIEPGGSVEVRPL